MAHAEKYRRNNIVGLAIHYERREGCELSNQNIDSEKSYLNYNLAQEVQSLKPEQFVSKRLSEVKHINRKDIVVMVDWIVTLPKNVPNEDERKFFELVYEFIKDSQGEKNIVCAWVHNDETTPHIHVSFVPVINEDGIERLNCKKILTKPMLKQFHPSLGKFLEQSLGYLPEIQNGATINGNRTIKELRNKEDLSLKKSLSNIHEHINESEKIIEKTKGINYEASGLLEKTKSLKKCNLVIDELKHNNKQLRIDTKSLIQLVSLQKKQINTYREMPLSKQIDEKEKAIQNLCLSIKKLEEQNEYHKYRYNKLEKINSQSCKKISKLEGLMKIYKTFISILGLEKIFKVFKNQYINNHYSIDVHILKQICNKAYKSIKLIKEKITSRTDYLDKKQLPTENIKLHQTEKNHYID